MNKLGFLCLGILLMMCREQHAELVRNTNTGPALGTSYSIIYLAEQQVNFQQEIDSVFKAINKSMSTYINNSDISRINNGDTTVFVDDMFRDVFELSKEVHKKTGGYFDPTVGVLVNAWGFGPGEQIAMDSTKVDSLLRYVGFHKVKLNKKRQVLKELPQIQFDFNAIAKGYALDRLAVLLNEKGIDDYLIEVGGEVITKGENRLKDKLWTVGIEDPQNAGAYLKKTITLKNRALASSGNYRKFRVDPGTGEKYVHTVDPKTGFTKNSRILGSNVLAGSCAKADAFATAIMAMALDEAIEIVSREKDLDVYIIYLNDNGDTEEFMTAGFKALVVQ